MQSSDTINVQNGIESHPIVIEKVLGNISRKEFIAMRVDVFGRFGPGQFTQPGAREMNKISGHDPVPFSTHIETHLQKWKGSLMVLKKNIYFYFRSSFDVSVSFDESCMRTLQNRLKKSFGWRKCNLPSLLC